MGLPPAPRRRTPGLRREEVATLAGVGVTWYTWLEQGRPINASAQVLDAVAATLRLDSAQRWHMYELAEAMPLRLTTEPAEPPADALGVLHALDPTPAVLVNARFDVLEANDGHHRVFADFHSLPCVHRNLLWCCVTEPAGRQRLVNYDEEIRHLVARLRAEYARHVGDPAWEEDIRRLGELSPEFAELWARQEVARPATRVLRVNHPVVGPLDLTRTELNVAATPGLRLVVYGAHNPATAEHLRHMPPAEAAATR